MFIADKYYVVTDVSGICQSSNFLRKILVIKAQKPSSISIKDINRISIMLFQISIMNVNNSILK